MDASALLTWLLAGVILPFGSSSSWLDWESPGKIDRLKSRVSTMVMGPLRNSSFISIRLRRQVVMLQRPSFSFIHI